MSRLNVGNLFNENEDGAPVVSGISTFSSPNYFVPPSGSTAQRPQNPGEGMIRFNTDSGHLEYYSGELWVDVITNNNELGDQNNSNSSGGTGTRGLFAGGSGLNSLKNEIEYHIISTLGNSQDFGNLVSARTGNARMCISSRGIFANGGLPDPARLHIDFVTISSTGNASDFGDLSAGYRGALSNQTRAIIGGGETPTAQDVMDYGTIASTGDAVDFGNFGGSSW